MAKPDADRVEDSIVYQSLVPKMLQPDRIENSFTYHPPKGDQAERYVLLRDEAKDLAVSIVHNCPDSRERSLAITKLEEAIMWANKSIACNE